MDHYCTVKEVAVAYSRTPAAVLQWIYSGKLPSVLVHPRLRLIPRQALDGFEPPKRGRKPKPPPE